VARDLQQHRGSSIVIAGDYQTPEVHALAHAMNHALSNVGKTVTYTDPVEAEPADPVESLRRLVKDMEAGQVDLLVIIGANPVYSAPADLNFAASMSKVGLRVHLSLYYDETSELCHWHIPQAHFLESWSDVRAYDGTISIVQPLIAPLYHGKTAHELLAAFTDQPERTSYEIVRDYWKTQKAGGWGAGQTAVAGTQSKPDSPEFDKFWRKALHDGFVPNTASPQRSVSLRTDWTSESVKRSSGPLPSGELEIVFRPDPTVYDGRFANNGWLQELPKPLTKLTWDNAALVSPATAQRLGLSHEIAWRGGEHGQVLADVVELQFQGRKVLAPVWIAPGHADDCITVHLGYGRKRAGRVGTGAGFSANTIRTSDSLWFGSGLSVTKTGGRYPLACAQYHHNIEGRNLLPSNTLNGYKKDPKFAQQEFPDPLKTPSLYPGFQYKDYAWGMAIDLNSCVGCNACVIACQSENNIPIVGKEQVMRGREMHWLRIDQYHKGEIDNPEVYYQPVLCQHCEHAPCEIVCPVQATTHSAEGLNTMVYNRCVGTRYCSNNCPYKVRRFNFLQFADWETASLKLLTNPEVSVRSRGVMEKCTYCVQRISHAKINAERENRPVRDGEVLTACQAVCPAQAIVFGNINDPDSRVAKLKKEPRNYGLLAELNTRPRTTYLAAVRNPNPELEKT
jgi:molybdopterin-containing oxidoreductase family iron-sulfur binding subunit